METRAAGRGLDGRKGRRGRGCSSGCRPKAWRSAAIVPWCKQPENTVIRLQRLCARSHGNRSAAGLHGEVLRHCWRAFCVQLRLPAAHSLRAHEPNPAGRAVHRDLAGEYFLISHLAAGAFPSRTGVQTFLASRPSGSRQASACWRPRLTRALVHEPAHADIHRHTQRQKCEQHRRPSVTHER